MQYQHTHSEPQLRHDQERQHSVAWNVSLRSHTKSEVGIRARLRGIRNAYTLEVITLANQLTGLFQKDVQNAEKHHVGVDAYATDKCGSERPSCSEVGSRDWRQIQAQESDVKPNLEAREWLETANEQLGEEILCYRYRHMVQRVKWVKGLRDHTKPRKVACQW